MKLANKMKDQLVTPDIMKPANITSIYKNKGERSDLNNERGLFGLKTVQTIVEKLIYHDEYETIDESMSDCNIGSRKERNIRNHLFVVYSVLN